MELLENPEAVLAGNEQAYTEEELLTIRHFCIDGLASSVPEFMSRDKAADLLGEWFPHDQLAIAALYRKIEATS